jgi:hypothetical protein
VNGRFGPIVLKNSASRLGGSDGQNTIPQSRLIANHVYKMDICENKVPAFQSEFRASEFFNRIGRIGTFAHHDVPRSFYDRSPHGKC